MFLQKHMETSLWPSAGKDNVVNLWVAQAYKGHRLQPLNPRFMNITEKKKSWTKSICNLVTYPGCTLPLPNRLQPSWDLFLGQSWMNFNIPLMKDIHNGTQQNRKNKNHNTCTLINATARDLPFAMQNTYISSPSHIETPSPTPISEIKDMGNKWKKKNTK